MKEKIANELKTKYANLGLSNEAFDGVASLIGKTVTDEAGIASAVADENVASYLKSLQSSFDKMRGDASTAKKALEDYKKLHPDTKPTDNPAPDENKAMIDALRAETEAIRKRLEDSEKAERVKRMTNEVEAGLKAKGATNDYVRKNVLKGLEIGENDTTEALIEKYQKKYDAEMKEAYGEGYIPPRGGASDEGYKAGMYSDRVKMLQREGLLPKSEK